MSAIGTFNSANSLPGDLTKTLLSGLTAQSEQALKAVAVQMETKTALQEQANTLAVAAMMTGVGTQLNATV